MTALADISRNMGLMQLQNTEQGGRLSMVEGGTCKIQTFIQDSKV